MKNLIPNANIRKTDDGMFSVIDVVKELTGYSDKVASNVLKRIESNSADISSKMVKKNFGTKGRPTPVATRETLLQIMQMLPGLVGDKIRKESAKLVLRFIDADITLADDIIQRTEDPDKLNWIAQRAKGKAARNKLTSTLAQHGVNKDGFRDCTNGIYKPLFGGSAAVVREKVGVKEGANPREAMTTLQLGAVMLAEEGAAMIVEKQGRHGNWQCEQACIQSSSIIANAMRELTNVANSAPTLR